MSKHDIWDVIEQVRDAWHANRAIVPLVGAGISADSGIPIVRSIVRYFGKLQQSIDLGAYLAPPSDPGPFDRLNKFRTKWSLEPWEYVRLFGWPDRFQLNQDLLDILGTHIRDRRCSVAEAAQLGVEIALHHSNPAGASQLAQLKKDVVVVVLTLLGLSPDSALEHYNRYVEDLNKSPYERLEARNRLIEQLKFPQGDPRLDMLHQILFRFESNGGSSVPFDVAGDWKRLIQYFTDYQGDYADALITRLCAGRGPSLGHQFLAYFSRLVGSKLICTYNFDDLIERSFQSQGVYPRVFAMEEGVRLPPATLVRDNVSVLKLHGNNHALLLDERVDHPLSKAYKDRFSELVGTDPLLLVVGCSGNDMRVRDLVRHVLTQPSNGSPASSASVVWLHFESETPPFLKKWAGKDPPRVFAARTNNPGADLLHIYTGLSGRHPAGTLPYPVYLARPTPIPSNIPRLNLPDYFYRDWKKLTGPDYHAVIISTLEPLDHNKQPRQVEWIEGSPCPRTASELLVDAADWWLHEGYQIIWIDLESLNTIAGVAGSILDQCRAFDIHLAASVLKDDELAIDSAVRRVAHALQRSRYFVALDGLDAYPWGPLTHHGDTHFKPAESSAALRHLMQFFYKLAGTQIGESRVWLGVDPPKPRNASPSLNHLNTALLRDIMQGAGKDGQKVAAARADAALWWHTPLLPPSHDVTKRGGWESLDPDGWWPLLNHPVMQQAVGAMPDTDFHRWTSRRQAAFSSFVLLNLSCFRRTRPLATLRHQLGPLFDRRKVTRQVDILLKTMSEKQQLGLIRVSGGGVWFNRSSRDYVYGENSKHTSTESIGAFLNDRPDKPKTKDLVQQLFLLSTTHQRISRAYHNRAFVQSRDCFAFLEYTYHRISSIRYLTKLIAVAAKAQELGLFGDVRAAFRECGNLLKNALGVEHRTDDRFLEFLARMELDSKQHNAIRGLLLAEVDDATIDHEQLNRELLQRHTWEIRCLYRGWVRTEQDLREQLPAQQLLLWATRLVEEEFVCRLNTVVIRYDGTEKDHHESRCWNPHNGAEVRADSAEAIINYDAEPWIIAFKSFVRDLIVKLHIDRTDYAKAISMLKDQANQRPGQMRRVHRLLDSAVCHLRAAHTGEHGTNIAQSRRDCTDCLTKAATILSDTKENIQWLESKAGIELRKYKEERDKFPPAASLNDWQLRDLATASADRQEALLRLQHIQAEESFHEISVFSTGFYVRDLSSLSNDADIVRGAFGYDGVEKKRISLAKTAVDEGLREYRSQLSYGGRAPRGALVERDTDGTVYPIYRSIFYTLLGRLDWQREWLNNPAAFSRPGIESTSEATFEATYRAFEMARGGVGPGNRLLLALNELYFVEASLVHARLRLFQATEVANHLIGLSRLCLKTSLSE